MTITVLAWGSLGFKLAFPKAMRGVKVNWIGATIRLSLTQVSVELAEEKLDDIRLLTDQISKPNVIARKVLRSYAGKTAHMASIVEVVRPFLQGLWAALCSDKSPGAPRNCVWTSQITTVLTWVAAFLSDSFGH